MTPPERTQGQEGERVSYVLDFMARVENIYSTRLAGDPSASERHALELWWQTLPESEQLSYVIEIETHAHPLSLFWLNLQCIQKWGMLPSKWVEDIQSNDWHTTKRASEKRVAN